jgi:type VI secretion system secreted protein VgrG
MTPSTPRRGLTIRSAAIPEVNGAPLLEPLKLEGEEGINALFEYRLVLQSAEGGAPLELNTFIGRELTCCLELEGQGSFVPGMPGGAGVNQGAGVREISGLITEARYIGESGRHALVEFTLRPWLHLATLSTDCKVFQDQSPVEIIEAVLGEYPFAADKRLIERYPRRDYTVQYNESDYEFVSRLMQEWGINHHFEHSAGVHRLVWSDHNGAFQAVQPGQEPGASPYHRIPYHPLGHQIDREYIHGFSPVQRLTSGRYASRDFDYTRPGALLEVNAQGPRQTGHANQEVYLWRGDRAAAHGQPGITGSDHSQPNAGAQKEANQTEAQGAHLARLRQQALRHGGQRVRGLGHVRGIVPGCSFHLTGHPHESANTEYLTLQTHLLIENVGEDTQRGAFSPVIPQALTDAQRLSGQWRVQVSFEVQPSTEALRPEASQRKPRTGGPESAVVVGPHSDTAQSDLYTDALGRIKVQFPWDRYGQKNQNSSCWVRVSSAWAGNQLGAMHLPRVGQEVIVSFLGGDPDQPIVTGRVYNQANQPPWSLPEQKALSGFRSRELTPGGGNAAGGRSNHLILDDTDRKIQAQLKSDHQHSQLGLGHLTRIEDQGGRKDERGEGFELRTDGHGVLRAKEGLLISTEGRQGARAHAKDMGETTSRLEQGQTQHESLGELAQQHRAQEGNGADQAEVAQQLQAQNEAIKGTGAGKGEEETPFPELSEPHLVLASPAGIESTTAGSTHQHSTKHHAITAGGHASVSAGKSWLVSAKEAIKLFAYKHRVRLTSAETHVEIQALQKSLNLLSKLDISMTADRITLSAKEEVVINGGGSYTIWNASGITSGTTGTHTVQAESFSFPPGQSMPVQPLPETTPFNELPELYDKKGRPVAGFPYELVLGQGRTLRGVTNGQGETQRVGSGEAAATVRMNHDSQA